MTSRNFFHIFTMKVFAAQTFDDDFVRFEEGGGKNTITKYIKQFKKYQN